MRPTRLSELARVQGVGEAKLSRYGEAMLAVIAAHEETGHVPAA